MNEGEDLEVAWDNDEYSSITFGKRAVQIIEEHDQSKVL